MAPLTVDDLRTLAWTDVTNPLPKEQLLAAFQTPPFIYIPGTFNTRDVGQIPLGNPCIRPNYVFRTGALSSLTPEGKQLLASKLGIKKIFDLRSLDEHAREPDPEDIPGVQVMWTPPKEVRAEVDLAPFVDGEGERGYAGMYMAVLDEYKGNIRQVLEHVRDRPEEPFIFHCTAGRDRTGVVSGILMTLAGADPETVIFDFMLSRIGTEPAREKLLAFAMKGSGAESVDTPGFRNMCNLRPAGWTAFVKAAEEAYGGFEGYVTKTLQFSGEELEVIRRNLTLAN
ncbi:Protein-tyrosine phosphatase-like protein [Naviculisporaceae sp. PSN 640]